MHGTNAHPNLTFFPLELLLSIAAYLGPSLHHLTSLLRTNRRLKNLILPVLLQRAVTALDRRNRRTPLHWASVLGRVVLLARLLRRGAAVSINNWDKHGGTALHSAVICGSTTAVAVLLRHGADPKIKNRDGWAALHPGAITGNLLIAGLLLDYGASVATRSSSLFQKSPLHYAVLLRHVALVELFLAHGADVNGADDMGMTVAQKAA